MSNFFPEDDTVTESEEKMREAHVQKRLARAVRLQTVDAMIERYKEYERNRSKNV